MVGIHMVHRVCRVLVSRVHRVFRVGYIYSMLSAKHWSALGTWGWGE